MKMEQCSEMLADKIHTPGNYPEESKQHSEHGESLKSRTLQHPRICRNDGKLANATVT